LLGFDQLERRPGQVLSRAQPNRWFPRARIVESMHWMVLRRPVELAAFTGQMDFAPRAAPTKRILTITPTSARASRNRKAVK